MSNPETIGHEGTFYFDFEPQNALAHNEKTAVFENLVGHEPFVQRVVGFMTSNPNRTTNISIFGVPGAGKETTGGHFINYLDENKQLQSWLKNNSWSLEVLYVSFADMIKGAQSKGWVKHPLGSITPPEYAGVSILFRDTVAAINNEERDPETLRLAIYETPTYRDIKTFKDVYGARKKPYVYLGDMGFGYLGRDEIRDSHFGICLIENEDVIKNTVKIRKLIEKDGASEKDFQRLFKRLGIVWEGFDINKVSEYAKSMGTARIVENSRKNLDEIMVRSGQRVEKNSRVSDVYPDDFIDTIDPVFFRTMPGVRALVQESYYKGLFTKRFHINESNLLIAENTPLPIDKVVFFREEVDKYRIDIEKHLEAFAKRYAITT